MVEIKLLSKYFGSLKVLDKLNLDIKRNSIFGLLGRNGAGKTTLMKIMLGLIPYESGKVLINNLDIKDDIKEIREKISYVPDEFGDYENLSVYEYMDFFASAYKIKGFVARKKIYDLLEKLSLEEKINFEVSLLSKGMKQRLAIARALINNPEFLIMDEPTSLMDFSSRVYFREMLRQLALDGTTIFLSSHMLSDLQGLCTHIGIIEKGKVIESDEVTNIIEKLESSNPIKIKILQGFDIALGILKKNPFVTSISFDKNNFSIGFTGDKIEEAKLLHELIKEEVPVLSFVKEEGDLESFFIKSINKSEEIVILKNEY